MTGRNSQHGTKEWEDEPGEYALYEPVALPAPFPDLVDRNVAAGLAEGSDRDDK